MSHSPFPTPKIYLLSSKLVHDTGRTVLTWITLPPASCQGEQGYGGEGKGKGTYECRISGDQEVWEEVVVALTVARRCIMISILARYHGEELEGAYMQSDKSLEFTE